MKTTYHSEFHRLKSVFIKPAKNAFISEEILEEQWQNLYY
jgi:hypothetical protein